MPSKEILRGEIKRLLNSIPREEFRSQGAKAAAILRSSIIWSRYMTVFLFLSMNSEIDTQPLLETALTDGKKVFAPKIEAERLVFYPIYAPDGPWRRGPYGTREPAGENTPAAPGDFPALILAPGLAFDREGNRLGRGGGYYDRFFAELDKEGREYTALGFCMISQIIDRVSAGEKDKKTAGFLTAQELCFNKP